MNASNPPELRETVAWECEKERDEWNAEGTALTGRKYTQRKVTTDHGELACLRKLGWTIYPLSRSAPASAEGWPVGLHPVTTGLVQAFSAAMANKLRKAEQKYGYGVSWLNGDWEADCRAHLHDHIAKSDPLDVANYCAFMWHHGWSTASPPPPSADRVEG